MADNKTLTQVQLVDRLADGFVALLKQVEELKRHNEEVAKLLGHEHKVHGFPHSLNLSLHDDIILALDL